ncbi:cancer/testis antigen family 47 member C1 [Thomomys bottae]
MKKLSGRCPVKGITRVSCPFSSWLIPSLVPPLRSYFFSPTGFPTWQSAWWPSLLRRLTPTPHSNSNAVGISSGVMSAAGNGDGINEGQEGRVSPTGEWAQMAQEGDGMGGGSGPEECDVALVVEEAEVSGPGVAEVMEAEGGLDDEHSEHSEHSEQAVVLAPGFEGSNTDEDSDIGPADEEGGDQNMSHGPIVDARQFPMVGFRFMFLDLVHTLLHRLHYNDHILVRSGHHLTVRPRSPAPDGSGELLALPVPQRPTIRVASLEGEGEGVGAAGLSQAPSVLALEEPREGIAATLDSDEPSEEVAVVSTEHDTEEEVAEMAAVTVDQVVEGPAKDSVEHVTVLSEITQEQEDDDKEENEQEEEEEKEAEEDTKEENQSY